MGCESHQWSEDSEGYKGKPGSCWRASLRRRLAVTYGFCSPVPHSRLELAAEKENGMPSPYFQTQNLYSDSTWPLKWFTGFSMSSPNTPRHGSIMLSIFFSLLTPDLAQIPAADQKRSARSHLFSSPTIGHFPLTFTCPVTLQSSQSQKRPCGREVALQKGGFSKKQIKTLNLREKLLRTSERTSKITPKTR